MTTQIRDFQEINYLKKTRNSIYLKEQQNQEYSLMARDAIAQSFKSRGLRSFAGGDFRLDNDQHKS